MFTVERLKRIAQIEEWHFWFVGRQQLIQRLMSKYISVKTPILDIGCGTGYLLNTLRLHGIECVGLDARAEGIETVKRKFPDAALVQADAIRMPFVNCRFEAAILLDVIEHVDDQLLLSELHRLLKSGGIAILTTPALPWLWSYRDDAAGHLRRYTAANLRRRLMDSGFTVTELRYYQCLLFPIIFITRKLGQRRARLRDQEDLPPKTINAIFTAINLVEVSLSRFIRWPWGSTLVVVFRKI